MTPPPEAHKRRKQREISVGVVEACLQVNLLLLPYEGVVLYARRGESFYGQVRDPITELVVTCRDKAALLAVKGMSDGESGVAAFVAMVEVWGI